MIVERSSDIPFTPWDFTDHWNRLTGSATMGGVLIGTRCHLCGCHCIADIPCPGCCSLSADRSVSEPHMLFRNSRLERLPLDDHGQLSIGNTEGELCSGRANSRRQTFK